MKYEPGERLSEQEMRQQAEAARQEINLEFLRCFGHLPYEEELVWECRQKKCGWWDDSSEDLRVIERHYTDRRSGVVVPGGLTRVQVVCPQCGTAVQARHRDNFLAAARANGTSVTVWALKNKRKLSSLHPQ